MIPLFHLSWLRLFAITMLAIVASFTIEPALGVLLPVPPAIPLAAVCVIAAQYGPLYGVVAGFFAGFLLDFFGAGAIGIQMGALAFEGYVIGRAIRFIPPWPQILRVAFVAPLMLVALPSVWLFALIAGDSFSLGGIRSAVGFTAVNLVCAVLITPFISAVPLRTRTD